MYVQVSKEVDSRLKSISKTLGFDENQLVERAVLFYLDAIAKQVELKDEFSSWDKISDKDLTDFEERLR